VHDNLPSYIEIASIIGNSPSFIKIPLSLSEGDLVSIPFTLEFSATCYSGATP